MTSHEKIAHTNPQRHPDDVDIPSPAPPEIDESDPGPDETDTQREHDDVEPDRPAQHQ